METSASFEARSAPSPYPTSEGAFECLSLNFSHEAKSMLEGFLEYVDAFTVRGWARDKDAPGNRLAVQVHLHDGMVGETSADVYRKDIEEAGLSDGWSGFSFNFPSKVEAASLETVNAFAVEADGALFLLEKLKPEAAEEAKTAQAATAILKRQQFDTSEQESSPIFVLGAARSGTSAMALALNTCLGNEDMPEEGHFLHVLSSLSQTLATFYEAQGEETGRNTLIQRIPVTVARAALEQTIKTLAESAMTASTWVDKTPTPAMLDIAPKLLRIWPNARFIFMRRRALDNIASRKRRFPDFELEKDCREWAYVMNRWHSLRSALKGHYIEVDQYELMTSLPHTVEQVTKFLNLSKSEAQKFLSALKTFQPQRTIADWGVMESIDTLGWSKKEKALFVEICGAEMERYGYSYDEKYFGDVPVAVEFEKRVAAAPW
jgi:hypothetical protein